MNDPLPRPEPIATTGRFVVFRGPGRPLELRSGPLPSLRHGEILVRNVYATLCRSDINTWAGHRREAVPTILGHETVGRIEALGPGTPAVDWRGRKLHRGDRVTWAVWASDPDSARARRGLPQKAPGLFKYGHELLTDTSCFHGGLADYTVLRRHTPVLRLDDAVPDAVAAPIGCAFATVAAALRLAGEVSGRRVFVSGAGMLGLICCAMVKTAGATHVTVQDVDSGRLVVALRFGADAVVAAGGAPAVPDPRPEIAFEFSGATDAVEHSVRVLDVGGVVVWVGATHPGRAAQIEAEYVVRNLLTIRGLHNYDANDLAAAVRFVDAHHATFPFATLVHGGFTLDDADRAFQCAHEQRPFRIGIRLDRHGD